jgi:hypothetical protein
MHLTPTRLAFLALPFLLAAACGQVTGLSGDYLFDLTEAGTANGDAAGDAASSDGSLTDARADAFEGAAPKCSATQSGLATNQLSTLSGAPACKTCLANACCTDVETCMNTSTCSRALTCRLDCTTKTGIDRTDCFNACANGGSGTTPPLFTNGVGACSGSSCKSMSTCAFQ